MSETLGANMVIRSNGVPEVLIPSVRSALHPIIRASVSPSRPSATACSNNSPARRWCCWLVRSRDLRSGSVCGLLRRDGVRRRPAQPGISVRVALGASGRDIMRLLLRDSLRPALFGLAGGVFVALLGSRMLAGTLYGVGSADPI